MCNDAKKRAIYAVSKRIGVDVDWNELDKLTDEQASRMIDELKLRQQEMEQIGSQEDFNQARFGMVVKLVFGNYFYNHLKKNPQTLATEAKELYELVTNAERHIRASSVAELAVPPITVRQSSRGGSQ